MTPQDLQHLKTAFWLTFHKSGEIWFDYLTNDNDAEFCTNEYWQLLLENLQKVQQVPSCDQSPDPEKVAIPVSEYLKLINALKRISNNDGIRHGYGYTGCGCSSVASDALPNQLNNNT